MAKCKHCSRDWYIKAKGLCERCYANPQIRVLYPNLKGRTGRRTDLRREPTEDELDAIIAAQMKRLPRWWYNDTPACERSNNVKETSPLK